MNQKEKYLVYIASNYVPKNNLHKDVHAFFETINRQLHTDLKALKKLIKEHLIALNTKHNRCKPVKWHYWESSTKTIVIGALPQISVYILRCKEVTNDK